MQMGILSRDLLLTIKSMVQEFIPIRPRIKSIKEIGLWI